MTVNMTTYIELVPLWSSLTCCLQKWKQETQYVYTIHMVHGTGMYKLDNPQSPYKHPVPISICSLEEKHASTHKHLNFYSIAMLISNTYRDLKLTYSLGSFSHDKYSYLLNIVKLILSFSVVTAVVCTLQYHQSPTVARWSILRPCTYIVSVDPLPCGKKSREVLTCIPSSLPRVHVQGVKQSSVVCHHKNRQISSFRPHVDYPIIVLTLQGYQNFPYKVIAAVGV